MAFLGPESRAFFLLVSVLLIRQTDLTNSLNVLKTTQRQAPKFEAPKAAFYLLAQ